jgi:hypothetical protein
MKSKQKPAYVRDAEWEIARSLANLWVWSKLVEEKELPIDSQAELFIYTNQLANGGPENLNGCRVVVKLSLEKPVDRIEPA